jgi:hypothetical protein
MGASEGASSPATLMAAEADGRVCLGTRRNEVGGALYARRRVEAVATHLCGLQELKHGRGGGGDVRRTSGQWGMVVRLPASAHRPRGTGLDPSRASLAIGA